MNRLMLSLSIADDELYSEFIKPWNDEKALKPLIYDLLKAYYSNAQFRAEADACRYGADTSADDISTLNNNFNELLAEARQSLAMMTAVTETFEGSVDSSLETILDMVDNNIDISNMRNESENHPDVETSMLPVIDENQDIKTSDTSLVDTPKFDTPENSGLGQVSQITEEEISSLVTKVVDERMSHVETEIKETKGSINDIMSMLKQLTQTGIRSAGVVESTEITQETEVSDISSDNQSSEDMSKSDENMVMEDTSQDIDLFDMPSSSSDTDDTFESSETSEDDIADDFDDTEEEGMSALSAFLNNGVGFSESV